MREPGGRGTSVDGCETDFKVSKNWRFEGTFFLFGRNA